MSCAHACVDADPVLWESDADYRRTLVAAAQADARAMGCRRWAVCIGARHVAAGSL